MADNLQVTPGTGPSIALDDVGGILFPRSKQCFGDDGIAIDVSATNPMPVADPLTRELIDGLMYLLNAINEKMPRVDANDRVVINSSDQGNVTVAIAATQTLATVTTVGTLTTASDVTRLNNMGESTRSMPTSAIPLHMGNAGSLHLYDNIRVT